MSQDSVQVLHADHEAIDAVPNASMDSSTQKKRCFLDLPYELRRKIYIHAGLVRFCPISMNDSTEPGEDVRRVSFYYSRRPRKCCYYVKKRFRRMVHSYYSDETDCMCIRIPTGLFYTNRVVSRECSKIFYSENKFAVCRSYRRGLEPLMRLSNTTLAMLTTLSIRLNACPCFSEHIHPVKSHWSERRDYRECNCHGTCKGGFTSRELPFGRDTTAEHSTLADWKLLCSRLAVHMQPSRLGLSFICDFDLDSSTTASREVLEPLYTLPRLRACSIRLSQHTNHTFRSLAEAAVHRMTETPVHAMQPNRLQLPNEILLQILRYTDLIAPYKLLWEPKVGLKIDECCRLCTECLEVCCCMGRHGAFSQKCVCWAFPKDLYLVNSTIKEMAEKIFYRYNYFHPLHPSRYDGQPCEATGSLLFLTALPATAWKEIRAIALEIAGSHEENFLKSMDYKYYRSTVGFIRRNLDCAKLSIAIHMDDGRESNEYSGMTPQAIQDKETAMWERYESIIDLLLQPPPLPLKNLFLFLSYPLEQDGDWDVVPRRDEWEEKLEKRVVGATYDATYGGKFDHHIWREPTQRNEIVLRPDGTRISPNDVRGTWG